MAAAPGTTAAGRTALVVRNVGGIPHTFFVLRTGLAPGELPVVDNEVDLTAGELEVLGSIAEQLAPDPSRTVQLDIELESGPHVLICNVPGHYEAGMHAALSVAD